MLNDKLNSTCSYMVVTWCRRANLDVDNPDVESCMTLRVKYCGCFATNSLEKATCV